MLVALLLLPLGSTTLTAQDTTYVVVRGTVVDDETGQAIEDAIVYLPGGRSTLSDRNGSFLWREVPVGVLVLQAEAFGYHRLRTIIDATSDKPLQLRMIPSPTPLEGILATAVRPEQELQAAVKMMAVRTGLKVAEVTRAQFDEWGPGDPVEAIRAMSRVGFLPCDGGLCLIIKGHRVSLRVTLDGQQFPDSEVLSSLSASDIAYAVVVPRCGVIRVYTVPYFNALARRDWFVHPFLCP